MELKFKKLQEDAVLPSYANPNDAGLDLTAVSFTQEFDKSGKLVLVYHTGLSVEIPEGHVGLIFMRSSVSQKSMSMCNAVAVIDCDYKGEILVKFKITTDALPTIYQPGEKIAQLVVMPYPKMEPVIVEELSGEDRGGGFGSTDKKEENEESFIHCFYSLCRRSIQGIRRQRYLCHDQMRNRCLYENNCVGIRR